MITYNWDLAIKILILYILANAISLSFLGAVKAKKSEHYTWWDAAAGLILTALLIIPAFF